MNETTDCVINEYPFKNADLRLMLQAEEVLVAGGILNKSGRWMLTPNSACCHHNTSQLNER